MIAAYHAGGYLLPGRQALPHDGFTRLKDIFEEHLADAQARGERGDSGELDMPHARDPRLLEFLLADEILDVIEALLGPDLGLFASAFLSKEPFTGRATPWHEDSYFWQDRFDRMDRIVTVWLALDKVDRKNGCMRVIPGSHLASAGQYEFADPEEFSFDRVVAGGIDESKAVCFELEEGQFSLHDARIIHGAEPNHSSRRRAGYTIRYFSQELRFDRDHPRNDGHLLWHARGRNLHSNPVQN